MNTLQHNRTPGLGEHLALAMNSRAIASNGRLFPNFEIY